MYTQNSAKRLGYNTNICRFMQSETLKKLKLYTEKGDYRVSVAGIGYKNKSDEGVVREGSVCKTSSPGMGELVLVGLWNTMGIERKYS